MIVLPLKGTGRILLTSALLTLLLLLYVHGEVSLFHLSYQMDEQTEKLAQKTEAYRRLRFEVAELSAPRRLENKISDLSMDLVLPKEIQVIKLPAAVPRGAAGASLGHEIPVSLQQRFSYWVNRWVGVAQAKTDT